jgi:hypothetical protein
MGLSYDTSASVFFIITMFMLYLIPAVIVIVARVRDFNAKQKKDKPVSFPSLLSISICVIYHNSSINHYIFIFPL